MSDTSRATVLLLTADKPTRELWVRLLGGQFDCVVARDFHGALAVLAEHFVQVVVADPIPDDLNGNAFLAEQRERWPETMVVAVAEGADVDRLAGDVFHVLAPGAVERQLAFAVQNAARQFQLRRDNERLRLELKVREGTTVPDPAPAPERPAMPGFERILRSPSSPLNAIIEAARQYASFDVPVLLTGPDGTGKAEFARGIHDASLRSDRTYHAFDCSGLSEDLLALELFGARNGSVPTGQRSKIGLVQKADHGTLYLSGIEGLSPALQKRLLRVVRDGKFQPVGGQETVTTRVRLVTGTTADLPEMVATGSFRSDLYHALSVATLTLPPLAAHRQDIPHLARKMLFDAAAKHGKPVLGLSDAALEFLTNYDWPGNMRELENEVTRMLIFSQEKVLGPDLISRHILQADPAQGGDSDVPETVMVATGPLKDRVEAIEARILRETLTRLKWNKTRAAAELGLSRVGLRAKLDRYGVHQPDDDHAMEEG